MRRRDIEKGGGVERPSSSQGLFWLYVQGSIIVVLGKAKHDTSYQTRIDILQGIIHPPVLFFSPVLSILYVYMYVGLSS